MRAWLPLFCLLPTLGSLGSSPPAPSVEPDLRVETYNVNYGLAGDPETLEAIGAGEPDLVLLQETTPAWERVIRERYGGEYPHIDFIEGPGAGGQGVLSRHPLRTVEVLSSPLGWFPGWLLQVELPTGPLQVLGLHLKPPYDDRYGFLVGAFTAGDDRLQELDAYLGFVDPALPTVVLGDFNERRGPSLRLLEEQGFTDALPRGEDTWRWSVAGLTLRSALDHVFYSPGLHVVDAEVQQLGRSDHLPLLVGFTLE
jgi:endonuclease/exonuclease/phosphatase family metal-dependent hydrolase